jgi:hypothetical protein
MKCITCSYRVALVRPLSAASDRPELILSTEYPLIHYLSKNITYCRLQHFTPTDSHVCLQKVAESIGRDPNGQAHLTPSTPPDWALRPSLNPQCSGCADRVVFRGEMGSLIFRRPAARS